MPVITQLTAQKRGDYVNLYVDDEFVCGLTLTQVAARHLYRGKELSTQDLEELQSAAAASKAYVIALRYLGLRIRSVEEMYEYLIRKGFADYAEPTIARLQRENYLNDEDFAQRWWTMRAEQSRSPQAIRAELIKKGVAKDIIESVVSADNPQRIIDSIINLAEKKQRLHSVERQKLMVYLAGKGFRYDDIRLAMESRPDLFSRLS